MKNLKVKSKLLLSFGVVIVLTVILSLLSVFGMMKIYNTAESVTIDIVTSKDQVWEMRRNIMSISRYFLAALVEDDQTLVAQYIDQAEKESSRNVEIMNVFQQDTSIDKNKMDSLKNIITNVNNTSAKFEKLLLTGTDEDWTQAHTLFKTQLQDLLEEEMLILADIGEDQMVIANNEMIQTKLVYDIVLIVIIVGTVGALIISFIMAGLLLKAILIPLQEIKTATNALSQGDFSVDVKYESKDEFGELCKTIQYSFGELKRVIKTTANILHEMAIGNFSSTEKANFPGEIKDIENAGNSLLDNMNTLFNKIKSSSDQINVSSDQVASGAQALAQGATEQASSIQELSASLSEIAEKVNTNANNSKKANELATTSGQVAEDTQRDMQNMLEAMNEISSTSESISKVIKVIDEITFQTNILSLNAAVEAARAGAAGKGFGVVADEVRTLAQKSSESAKEITALIESTIAAVNQGEKIAQKTSEAFNNLAEKISDVVSTVNEIALASEEQSNNIQQITLGVDQISAVVQTNSATSEESAASSEELSSQANILNGLVSQFKLRANNNVSTSYIANDVSPEVDYSFGNDYSTGASKY